MIHDNLQDGESLCKPVKYNPKKAAAQRHPPTTHLYASPTFLRDSASAQQLAQIQTPTMSCKTTRASGLAHTATTDKQAAVVTSEAVTIAQLRERRRALGERECRREITKGERTAGNKPALIRRTRVEPRDGGKEFSGDCGLQAIDEQKTRQCSAEGVIFGTVVEQ
ncbi:hypothetical protein FB45DRAFT_867772 [Roridomyces roridus]|uniref:Uncharacterized protein n=1 Tax=Roridomyces roridus TaxID=1738132 RepID=A0AAD7BRY0_9AGAR|nr:hypothetical protein FB45DRAFT_867772 [Roridomyces roridus]